MMIWYGHPNIDAPQLTWERPKVSDRDKALMRANAPVPAHCKPWIDGQSAALVVVWPYDTVELIFTDGEVNSIENHVSAFALGHFSINPLYYFRTQENVGLYILPRETSEGDTFSELTVNGVIETDWYRPAPFFVFKNPREDCVIKLHRGQPLVRLLPIALDKGLAKMTTVQLEDQLLQHSIYMKERMDRPDLLWKSLTGQWFSRLYKEMSRKYRNADNAS